jgi:hypothetical protein
MLTSVLAQDLVLALRSKGKMQVFLAAHATGATLSPDFSSQQLGSKETISTAEDSGAVPRTGIVTDGSLKLVAFVRDGE